MHNTHDYLFDNEFDYEWTSYDDFDYKTGQVGRQISGFEDDKVFMSFYDISYACVIPTLLDISTILLPVLLMCFCYHLITIIEVPYTIKHAISAIFGTCILYGYFQALVIYPVLLSAALYLYIVITSGWKFQSVSLSLLALGYLVYGEFKIERHLWQRIHNVQMIIVMKVISLTFDLSCCKHPFPRIEQYFGYVLCVGNCVFGPWVTYADYLRLYRTKKLDINYFVAIVSRVFSSLLSFMITMCYTDWLFSDSDYKVLLMYKKGFEFRTSHYFITYMSEAFAIAAGIKCLENDASQKVNGDGYMSVSKVLSVEFPRSLIEIAIFWNIPMHQWFRNYVFTPLKSIGIFTSILCTYLVSSLLHGLNYQLSAVLLSLSFYTYIEYMFRVKLSKLFNACLLAKRCQVDCKKHKYTSDYWIVFVANFILSLIALYHLNYLSYLIDVNEQPLSFYESFQKWIHVGFSSHILAALTFILYFVL